MIEAAHNVQVSLIEVETMMPKSQYHRSIYKQVPRKGRGGSYLSSLSGSRSRKNVLLQTGVRTGVVARGNQMGRSSGPVSLTQSFRTFVMGFWKLVRDTPPRHNCIFVTIFLIVQLSLAAVITSLFSWLLQELNVVSVVLAVVSTFIVLMDWARKVQP